MPDKEETMRISFISSFIPIYIGISIYIGIGFLMREALQISELQHTGVYPQVLKNQEFRRKAHDNLAIDTGGYLTYLAPTRVNLSLMEERWPDIDFHATREH